jgi:hypothetical protein
MDKELESALLKDIHMANIYTRRCYIICHSLGNKNQSQTRYQSIPTEGMNLIKMKKKQNRK